MRAFRPGVSTLLDNFTAEKIADWTHVHVTTARRWKRGEEPPHAAMQWITLKATADLGSLDAGWAGWTLSDGTLVAPDQSWFTPAEVMAGPFWRRLARELQRKERMPRQADWIDGRWAPHEVQQAN